MVRHTTSAATISDSQLRPAISVNAARSSASSTPSPASGNRVSGVLTVEQALSGFGDPVVIFIASLFVVSEDIDSAGVTTWAGQRLLAAIGDRPQRALIAVILMAAVMSALVAVVSWLGPKVLPVRTPDSQPPDLSRYARTVAEHYDLTDGFSRLRVREHSPLVGTDPGSLDLSRFTGITLIGQQAPAGAPVPPGTAIAADDVLVVTGPQAEVSHLAIEAVLAVAMRPVTLATGELVSRELGVAGLVVPPRSPLVGETVFPGMARGPELVILGVRRQGVERGARPTELNEGDTLLVHGSWGAVEQLVDDRDVLVVNSPDLVRRQAVPLGATAGRAIAVLVVMIVLLAFGLVPPAVAGLGAAVAMVLLRVISSPAAYRSVSWQTVVLIGGLIPLSVAIRVSGAADLIADRMLDIVGDGHPLLILVAIFGLTAAPGQFVSNTATVLIVLPIAVAAAAEAGVSPLPVLMTLAVAGAAAFLTPVSTPANLMVMGPGGYRFGDYWRLGLPVLVTWLVLTLLIVPRVWPL